MLVTVRSFAKINLGLAIGEARADGFHELRTVYQTLALADVIRVSLVPGSGIEIRCQDSHVPTDETNTCYGTVERARDALRAKGRVLIEIEKKLPVQGGLGGASSNGVAALIGLERALRRQLPAREKLRIAAEVGSDLPLFLVGGTILGVGHGEEVYPLPDLPRTSCVLAVPEVGVSTPKAFSDWDRMMAAELPTVSPTEEAVPQRDRELTPFSHSDRISVFSRAVSSWLSGLSRNSGRSPSGVPAAGRGRAETPLLDLVRTGIENDFEKVVFPQHPELGELKRALERAGAFHASLSGSGSALYGLFRTRAAAKEAATWLRTHGIPARVTTTLGRDQYWKKIFD